MIEELTSIFFQYFLRAGSAFPGSALGAIGHGVRNVVLGAVQVTPELQGDKQTFCCCLFLFCVLFSLSPLLLKIILQRRISLKRLENEIALHLYA